MATTENPARDEREFDFSRNVSTGVCAQWREWFAGGETMQEIAERGPRHRDTVREHIRGGRGCSHETEAETGIAPIPDAHSEPGVTRRECGEWRTQAADGQLIREIARETEWTKKTVRKHIHNDTSCGHDTEAATGVAPLPEKDDNARVSRSKPPSKTLMQHVAGALSEQLTRNLGNTAYIYPQTFLNRTDIDANAQRIGVALAYLANDETDGQANARAFGLTIQQANPGANVPRWAVRRFEEGDRS